MSHERGKVGTTILIPGYHIEAIVAVAEGGGPYQDVVIVHNHSTHYLVGLRRSAEDDTMFVRWVGRYGDDDIKVVYAQALAVMMQLVLSH